MEEKITNLIRDNLVVFHAEIEQFKREYAAAETTLADAELEMVHIKVRIQIKESKIADLEAQLTNGITF